MSSFNYQTLLPYVEKIDICGVLIVDGKTYGRYNDKLLYKCIPDSTNLPGFLIPYEEKNNTFSKLKVNKYITFKVKEWNDKQQHPIGIITNTITIPLLAKALMPGQYTISAEDASNFDGCVIIKDKLLNVYNDLIINPYVFNLNDTNSSNRFELILCPFNKSVSVKELNESNNILISQDENGAFVKTFFEQNTKTVISVYNILGQKMTKDIILNEASAITRLDINNHNQILFVKVVANNQSVTKKIVTH